MDLVKTEKFLSLILRHKPETIDISLDNNGYANIIELITKCNEHGYNIDLMDLKEIVRTSSKKRFTVSDDGCSIKANQGHSLKNIELGVPAMQPPVILYHGTSDRFIDSIMKQGLVKGSRNHVHLSYLKETAEQVGKRHGGKLVVLTINSGKMSKDGYTFYLSKNNVWLTDYVPVEYINID